MEVPELLTLDEFARRIKCSVSTVRRMIRNGELPRPLAVSNGNNVWTQDDVFVHLYTVSNRHRFRASRKKEAVDAPKKQK